MIQFTLPFILDDVFFSSNPQGTPNQSKISRIKGFFFVCLCMCVCCLQSNANIEENDCWNGCQGVKLGLHEEVDDAYFPRANVQIWNVRDS